MLKIIKRKKETNIISINKNKKLHKLNKNHIKIISTLVKLNKYNIKILNIKIKLNK
jgi:hypothetical protein